MPQATPPLLRAAGYQSAGINAASLTAFVDACRPLFADGACGIEPDVTAAGASAQSLFKSVAEGGREVAYMASGYLSAQVGELGVIDLPFHVADRTRALGSLDGAAGTLLKQAVAAKSKLHVLGFWDNGFRHVSNRLRDIRTPADCAGMVCRTLDSALYRESLTALGFKPLTADVKLLRQMVASGEVDAQENPLTNTINFQLYEQHKHVSLTGHFFGVILLVCHAPWFDALSRGQQEGVQAAAREATLRQRQLAAAEDQTGVAVLESKGVKVIAAGEIDLAAMRERCAPIVARACSALPEALVQAYGRI
ncbi:MAG TPA: TRAP transporter substrate-binding protein [Burkholderiales bacterium]|jgi:TRAP-type C4-dicarboxylate transport system substrate-binding protein|nr:TRAP transporter substrate-binding protein [Burkholderiales bacterium]